jgi:hypothetical protein
MHGKVSEEDIYRLETKFEYADSVIVIHEQVKRYERLVKEQVEKPERARRDVDEAKRLQREAESLKEKNKNKF